MSVIDQEFSPYLRKVLSGDRLDETEAEHAFDLMVSGGLAGEAAAGFVAALAARGESVDEIVGGVRALRRHMIAVSAPPGSLDTCGAGGGKVGFCNVSTLTALAAAACGVPVAKHGNRALSSAFGSADLLEELGVPLDLEPAGVEACIREAGIGFMFAPRHHPAIRHVMPIRRLFGVRTVFNLLGSLCNPASAPRRLLGVFAPSWLEPTARVLDRLGVEKVWTVHGGDGMDELTLSGVSEVVEIDRGAFRRFRLTPEAFGLKRMTIPASSAPRKAFDRLAVEAFLNGEEGIYKDIVILNGAAALAVAEDGGDLRRKAERIAAAIESGGVRDTLETLRRVARARRDAAGGADA